MLLVMIMVLGMLPAGVLAAQVEATAAPTVDHPCQSESCEGHAGL